MNKTLLILDDEPAVLETLASALESLPCEILKCDAPATALETAKRRSPQVIITDLNMPGMDGLEFLRRVREQDPNVQVIVVTGYGSIEEAVAAIKIGAYDFITKPFKSAEIETTVQRAFEKAQLLEDNLQLRQNLRNTRIPVFAKGQNPAFGELLESAALAAESEATVLLLGESGTGKEILAQYIVAHSARAVRPFVTVNCAAIPDNLIETDLFGHKRGAFTGAHQDRKGRFQEAHTGTIFLDEVGDLPLAAQSKLLRVLQEGDVVPVGGSPQKVDVRVIAATNKPLRKMIEDGTFREDLYYRLNVITLRVLPLRERMEDLPAYIAFFLAKIAKKNRRSPLAIHPDALHILEHHPWPGNLRELENVIERAVILTTGDEITTKVLPPELSDKAQGTARLHFPRGMKMDEIEQLAIQNALQRNHGDRAKSAGELGIGERTIYRKLGELQAREAATVRLPSAGLGAAGNAP